MQRVPPAWACIALCAVACARARASEAPASAPAEPPTESAPQAPAGQGPSSAEQAGTPSTEYRTLAEAESALERAKAELDRFGFAAPPPAEPEAPQAPRSKKAESGTPEAGIEQKAGDGCASACRAFASLLRAADAVCRLETDQGGRCTRAQKVVSDAERRVATCGCPR